MVGAFAIVRDVAFDRDGARRIREQGRALIESDRRLRSLFANFTDVVAEGVETEAQLAFLRQYECDLVQGCVVVRALPAGKLERLLLDRRGAPDSTG